MERVQRTVPVGHVHRDAEHARRVAAAAVEVRTQHHPADSAVAHAAAEFDLEGARLALEERARCLGHALGVVGVHTARDPLAERGRLGRADHVEQLVHLGVPLGLRRADDGRPDADACRFRGRLQPTRKTFGASRVLDLIGHVELDTDEAQRLAGRAAFDHAAHEDVAPHAVGTPVPHLDIDRHAGGQGVRRRGCELGDIVRVGGRTRLVQRQAFGLVGNAQHLEAVLVVADAVGLEIMPPDHDVGELGDELELGGRGVA